MVEKVLESTGSGLAEAVLRAPGVCAWVWQVQQDKLAWSGALCDLYGIAAVPRTVDGFLEAIHPDDRERVSANISRFLASGETFEHEFRIQRPDGQIRWIIDRGQITREKDGAPILIEGVNIDVTSLRVSEEQARSAERRAAYAAKIGGLISWEIDSDTGDIIAEAGLPRLFGVSAQGSPTNMAAYLDCIHEDDRQPTLREFEKARSVGGRYSAEFRVVIDGNIRWLRGCGEGILVDGKHRVVGFNVDITHENEARSRLDLVNHELKHRVKNTLSLVQALAQQTLGPSGDPEMLQAFEDRLRALSASTDLMFRTDWEAVRINDLIRTAMVGPAGSLDRVRLVGPDVKVVSTAVFPLLLILHELTTNAVKHGGLGHAGEGLIISWSIEDARWHLLWRENAALQNAAGHTGFGSRLLTRLAKSLGGSIDRVLSTDGLCCSIFLPRRHLVGDPSASQEDSISV